MLVSHIIEAVVDCSGKTVCSSRRKQLSLLTAVQVPCARLSTVTCTGAVCVLDVKAVSANSAVNCLLYSNSNDGDL